MPRLWPTFIPSFKSLKFITMDGIKGKVVAITGASSGIGEAIARHLSALGAKVVLGARRTDNLAAIVESIITAGGEARYKSLDVTDTDDVIAFANYAVAE